MLAGTQVCRGLKCLYFGGARKKRAPQNLLWILCGGAIIPGVSDPSRFSARGCMRARIFAKTYVFLSRQFLESPRNIFLHLFLLLSFTFNYRIVDTR